MNGSKLLSSLILRKIGEQVERADHLVGLLPQEQIEWRPADDTLRAGELLGHLLESLAGFCAVLYALHGDELAHFASLREMKVNHLCGIEEARERMRGYMSRIEEGFAFVTDEELARRIPTLFAAEGEAALTLLLANLEHFINHKYQLFFYLKLLGVRVGTNDLYKV